MLKRDGVDEMDARGDDSTRLIVRSAGVVC
jgi:hypothetical protein